MSAPMLPPAPPSPVQTIAIAGGKGGTGKSTVAINLAVALADRGQRVLLMDADLALGNIGCMLDLDVHYDLGHVMRGDCALREAMLTGPGGVKVLPSPNGETRMANTSLCEQASLIGSFSDPGIEADMMIVDVASGLSRHSTSFSSVTREVIVVLCDEPACLQDTFSVIRAIHESSQMNRFRVLANRTDSSTHGLDLYGQLVRYTERRLDVLLDYCGSIPDDPQLRQAIAQQRSVVEASPRSMSSLAFGKLATRVERWPRPETPGGHMEFFVERLVRASPGTG